MNTESGKYDFVTYLWHTLSPYLGMTQAIIALLYLVVGGAHDSWPIVSAFIFIQTVINLVLALQSRKFKNVFVLSYTFGFINWFFCVAVVIISGGYPSLFWLTFILGAVQSGMFIGRIGALLNMLFAGIAMVIPELTHLNIGTIVEIGILLLLLLALGLITEKSTVLLLAERTKYILAEDALQQTNEKLKSSLTKQEKQTHEIALLTEMGEFLQACPTLEEAYAIIGHFGKLLFPSYDGVLLIYNASQNTLEVVSSWGEPNLGEDHQIFSPIHCWALRRGVVHFVGDTTLGLYCHHLKNIHIDQYVCAPMMAQGEIVGVLHLQGHSEEFSSDMEETENITQITSLSKTVGERVALAIANLRLQEILRNQSIRDPLTGLFNRRYLEETLEREIHRAVREQYPLGVIFMDIDHFKLFNDTYSHDVGDAVLRKLGEFLSTHVRYGDISCRYGGDEFVIVLPDASLEITKQRAEDIRSGVKYIKMEYRGAVIQNITLSLGVSAIPEIEASAEILLQASDAALRQAKAEGRDKVLVAQTAG